MSLRNWWIRKSGRAKVIAVLSSLLLVQIGLCFSTPVVRPWISAAFHWTPKEELADLGYMVMQAFLSMVTLLLLFFVLVFAWVFGLGSRRRSELRALHLEGCEQNENQEIATKNQEGKNDR